MRKGFMKIFKRGYRANAAGNAAFTLAEVLIVVTIIGVVAAMTLPTLLDVNQDKVFNTSAEVFETKMYQALKMMNVKHELARLDSTEDFVNNLEKNMKITKKCNNAHLDECFTKKISLMQGEKVTKPKNLSGEGGYNLTTSANLGHDDWETNVMGLQFANGITALLAYNAADCMPKSNSQGDLTKCIAMIYDVNANGDPNTVKQDIRTMNAPVLGSTCTDMVEIESQSYCLAYITSSGNGVDCTAAENAYTCGNLLNGWYRPTSTFSYDKNSTVAELALLCNKQGMSLVNPSMLSKIVSALGGEYMSQLAKTYSADIFVTNNMNPDLNGFVWSYGNGQTGTSIDRRQINSSTPIIGICYKAENN